MKRVSGRGPERAGRTLGAWASRTKCRCPSAVPICSVCPSGGRALDCIQVRLSETMRRQGRVTPGLEDSHPQIPVPLRALVPLRLLSASMRQSVPSSQGEGGSQLLDRAASRKKLLRCPSRNSVSPSALYSIPCSEVLSMSIPKIPIFSYSHPST